jgi:methyl acetate hydrolase
MPSSAPAVSHDVELFPGVPKTWGFLGMINDEPAPTARSAGAIAWAGLANTYWWVDPGRGLAGVMATQLLPFADPAALDLLAGFEMALH